jgi:hypothetical protein
VGPHDAPAVQLDTPAQQRLMTDLLGWGAPRPSAPAGLAARLLDVLETGLEPLRDDLAAVAARRPRRSVSVTRTSLRRLVCDGWHLDPEPYTHTWVNVRGTLTREAIAADWAGRRNMPAAQCVDQVWHETASRRPGDPSSLSAWLNAQPAGETATLRREVTELLETFREVWPPLPREAVVPQIRRPVEVRLAHGGVTLRTTPDLVLFSHQDDDLARCLVVDLKTGQPRSDEDRNDLRFSALLVTLAHGKPPFRWASFYVPEGRSDPEDLEVAALESAAQRVLEGVRQAVRVARTTTDEVGLELRAGSWCTRCLREDRCEVAAAHRALDDPA